MPGATLADGPFGVARGPLQGKALSYNNVLDAAAASALGRALRGPGVVIVKHTNPCGAAERATLADACDAALAILATKANLRVLLDEALADDDAPAAPPDPTGSIRSAGGAVLVTTPDVTADDPTTWMCATRRAPSDAELVDLDLAWRLVRGVTSNAIVLVRDRRLVGMGSGQTSR